MESKLSYARLVSLHLKLGQGCLSRGAISRLLAVSLNSASEAVSRKGLRSMSTVSQTVTLAGHVCDPSRTNDDV